MLSPWLQLSMAYAVQLLIDMINISIVGRLNDTIMLAAVSLGNIVVMMIVLAVL